MSSMSERTRFWSSQLGLEFVPESIPRAFEHDLG